jgi:hypothetical protein
MSSPSIPDGYVGPQPNTGGKDFRGESRVILPDGSVFDALTGATLASPLTLPPGLIAAGVLSDVDQTTQGAGKVLSKTPSGGKPFSWQTVGGGAPAGLYSGQLTKPTLAQFTQVPGSSSVSFADSVPGIYASSPNNVSNQNLALLTQTPPAPPYTYTALLADGSVQGTYSGGIGFYDGTKIEYVFVNTDNSHIGKQLTVQQNTNATTFAANVFALNPGMTQSLFTWLRIIHDGATLHYLFSADGANFFEVYTEAVGAFLTPTKVVFGLNAYNVSRLSFTLMSWLQT